MMKPSNLRIVLILASLPLSACGADGDVGAAVDPRLLDGGATQSNDGTVDGAACSDYTPDDGPAATGLHVVAVQTAAALTAAIAAAKPGDEITLGDGSYRLDANIAVGRPGTPSARIFVRAAHAGHAILELCSTEGFQVSASDWIFEDLIVD